MMVAAAVTLFHVPYAVCLVCGPAPSTYRQTKSPADPGPPEARTALLKCQGSGQRRCSCWPVRQH